MRVGAEGTRRLDVGDATVQFSDRGEGEPILLVHAGAFAAWYPTLADEEALIGFRLVAPVRAGYDSTTPAPGRHLTIADHAGHCAAVLDSLGVGQAHIVGHSSGSMIGLQLAVDRPDLVRSLVLVEPASALVLLPPHVAEGFGQAMGSMVETAAAGDLAGAFDTFMRVACAQDYRDVLLPALGPDGLRQAERDCGFFFRDEVAAVQEWTFDAAAASRITHPVVFVQGGASPPMVHGIVARLAGMLGNAQTVTVEGADHLLPLRDPATLAGIVADFATRHRSTARI